MQTIQRIFRAHWTLFFIVGVFAIALMAVQLAPLSASHSDSGVFGYGLVAHVLHADDGGDGGSDGGDGGDGGDSGGDGGDGGCCGGDSGGGNDGGGGDGGGGNPPTGCVFNCQPVYQPTPSCTLFNASPSSITAGQTSILTWRTQNVSSVTISPGFPNPMDPNSYIGVNPTVTTVYTLTGTGAFGAVQCHTTITVTQTPVQNPPSCALSASPTSIQLGNSSTLFWNSQNATSASINQGIGSVALSGSRSVAPQTTTTYVLTVSGPGGTATCQTTIIVEQPPVQNPPSCTLSASPTLIQQGNSSTLFWSSQNATSASINQGLGSVALSGSRSVSPNVTTTYILTVTGPGGTATCATTIVVEQPQTNPPSCTIYANPMVIQQGNSSTLSWTSTNATSASISQGIGSVALNGSRTVSPNSTTTYVLTVTGPGGTATCATTIVVQVVQNVTPSCTISVSPSTVQYGSSATLYWNSQNANSAFIDNGIGSVGVNGSYTVFNIASNRTYTLTVTSSTGQTATCQAFVNTNQVPNQPLSCTISASPNSVSQGQAVTLYWNSQNATSAYLNPPGESVSTSGSRTVYPNGTTTYILTVYGSNGQSATCQTTVYINQIPTPITPYCTIYANPTYITSGQAVTLTWNSQNATTAYLSNHGSVSLNGTLTVYPTYTTSYTLTVYGVNGQQVTCQTSVSMNTIPNQPNNLSCTLTANPTNISRGSGTTLTWNSYGAVRASLSDGIGHVQLNGSLFARPDTNRTYVLTVYDAQGRSAWCQANVNVNAGYPYVTLSQIPYTGDFGPLVNFLSYLAIVLAAFGGAYGIVASRGGVRGLIGSRSS